VIAQSI